jgi:hypothetical protein
MISKYYKIILFISLLLTINLKAQPFLFDVQVVDDSTLNFPTYRLDKIDLSNGSTSPFVHINEGFYTYRLVPSNDWVILIFKFCDETIIYNISDTTNYFDVPSEVGCFGGGIQYSANKNKIYYFEGYERGSQQLTSIDMLTGEIDSLLIVPTSYNQPIGNLEAFLSSNENVLYFNVMDTTYPVTVNDKDFVHYFSTVTNQLIKTERLFQFGYTNADGYRLHLGRKGKAIVESFFRNETKDRYLRLYDFDNDTGSVFVFYQGYTTPYFTGDGDYLIIPQTIYESQRLDNTGIFFIYDLENGTLVKTLTLPPNGRIYTFDKYPSNVYYTKDIGLPTQQVWVLKMDSIFNVLDLTSLNPSSALVNSPPFTLTVNGHGFDTLSTVYFNDTAKTTTYISDSVLTAEISTSDISVVGNYPVWVTDQWGTSDTLIFTVVSPPVLNSISPTIVLRYTSGGLPPSGLTVTATGYGFSDSSVAYFNGNAKVTTIVSDSVVTFPITGSEMSTLGNYPVWISTYGINSDTLTLSVVDNLIAMQQFIPTLQCVQNNGGGSYTAYFGYVNDNGVSIYVPIGSKNKFVLTPIDRGQPKLFLPGTHTNVFSVNFNGRDLTWTLDQTSVTANKDSTACP